MPRPPRTRTTVPLPRNLPNPRHPVNGSIPNPDPHLNQPTNWNHRHQLILYMDCAGQRVKEIAATLKYHPQRVRAIMGSPLYKQQKEDILVDLKDRTLTDLLEMIRRDAPENYQALVELRRTADDKVKLGAARAIQRDQDRVYPRKTEKVEERTIKLVVDSATIGRIVRTMGELSGKADAIDIDVLAEEVETPIEQRPLLAPRAVDELVQALQADERRSERTPAE